MHCVLFKTAESCIFMHAPPLHVWNTQFITTTCNHPVQSPVQSTRYLLLTHDQIFVHWSTHATPTSHVLSIAFGYPNSVLNVYEVSSSYHTDEWDHVTLVFFFSYFSEHDFQSNPSCQKQHFCSWIRCHCGVWTSSFLIHSSGDRHLSYFHCLAVVLSYDFFFKLTHF